MVAPSALVVNRFLIDYGFIERPMTLLNTRFAVWRKGEFVGTDEFGNRYYRAKSAIPDSIPHEQRPIQIGDLALDVHHGALPLT